MHFMEKVRDASFSPDGQVFAVGEGKHIKLFRCPALGVAFCPLVLHHKYTGHHDHVVSLDWSSDSSLFVTGSKDATARVYSVAIGPDFVPSTLSGIRDAVIGVFFAPTDDMVYLVGRDGAVHLWKMDDAETAIEDGAGGDEAAKVVTVVTKGGAARGRRRSNPKWRLQSKRFFNSEGGYNKAVSCAAFLKSMNLLVVGFNSGDFGLYEVPDLTSMHTLSMTNAQINTVAINETGEWLAFGSSTLGQLLVWEWQSETYVLKQQGHFYDLNTVAYSPDGQVIATGGDDNKVKLWNVASGFCFVTFTQHTGPVTATAFLPNGQAVLTASMDGTVRAFDLVRYRNFRTLVSNTPCQFCSLAVDPSGDIVCAGSMDTYAICVWSMQTGRLLDVLAAHEAPVTTLMFSPTSPVLCSGSWDTTVRFWDVFEGKGNTETLGHQSDVIALAYRYGCPLSAAAAAPACFFFFYPLFFFCGVCAKCDSLEMDSMTSWACWWRVRFWRECCW
jgi:periodic tryptophan protein 2